MNGTVERPDGITIPYTVAGAGPGPRLVSAHGLMGFGSHEAEELAALVDAGWTVATFDQRGHGAATPVTDPALYDPALMGADLWAVADALGWERCWVGGSSMGAATSAVAALAQPERVEGLIQTLPAIRDRPHELAPLFAAFAEVVRDRGVDALIAFLREFMASLGASEVATARQEDLRRHDSRSLECALRTVPAWVLPGYPARLSSLDVPVVVDGWPDDPVHPLATAEETAASCRGGRLVVLDMVEVGDDPAALGRGLLTALEGAGAHRALSEPSPSSASIEA